MADPGDGHLPFRELGKDRALVLSTAPREQGFPYQFAKKRAWFEVIRRRQFLEGLGYPPFWG